MLRGCSRLSLVFQITDIDVRPLILNSIALHTQRERESNAIAVKIKPKIF